MAKLNIKIPHRQPKDEALSRVKNLLGEVKREHGDQVSDLVERWSGDRGTFHFKVLGMTVEGTLKGKITEIVTSRANELLA